MYEIFAELLKEKGLKAADVTRATGVSSTVFSEWKKGKSKPGTEKLIKIANFLGVSIEYLTTGSSQVSNNEYEAKDENERKLLMLCRKASNASDEEKEALVKQFESTIDMYLKFKGINKE